MRQLPTNFALDPRLLKWNLGRAGIGSMALLVTELAEVISQHRGHNLTLEASISLLLVFLVA